MSQQTAGPYDLIDLQLTLDWKSEQGHHREIRHFPHYNIWRDMDMLPVSLQQEILHKPLGHSGSVQVPAGDIVPQHQDLMVHKVKAKQFSRRFHGRQISPRIGHFYPQGIVSDLPGVYTDNLLPLRVIAMGDETLTCDLNHPLANRDLTISCAINGIYDADDEHGGRYRDALEQLLLGPGMQIRAGQQTTDFFSGEPFRRLDETPDSAFYTMSRMVDHLDARALEELVRFYTNVLPAGADVLDLMASVNSHLSDDLQPVSVVGLGMNVEELAANPRLSGRLVHDLNTDTTLPFSDASFDAVICTVSVEYLICPLEIFREVNRVLKPGGLFINTFSNRWFPPKVTALWVDLHEFERIGLVAEYYLCAGGFGLVHTWSQQGLKRPDQDKYGTQLAWSDPLYAVWSHKKIS